jgi:hypothetical protein
MSHQTRALDPGGVQEGDDIDGQVIDRVAAGRTLRVAKAALVEGEGVMLAGKSVRTRLNENRESGQPWTKTIASPLGSPWSA